MRKVRCIDTGEVFDSVVEAAAATKCSHAHIVRAIRMGLRSGGCNWCYEDAPVGSAEDVMKGRSMVCFACRRRGPMADGSGIFWCSTCPVKRIYLSDGV